MWNKVAKYLIRGILYLIGKLPLGFHRFNAVWIAWILENVIRYRTTTAYTNIRCAFPEKSDEQCRQICHRFYLHLTTVFLEAIWFGSCDSRRLRKAGVVEMDNPEVLQHLYEVAPSVVCMSSHLGNWELFGGVYNYDTKGVLTVPENDYCCVFRKVSSGVMNAVMADMRIAPVVDKEHFTGYQESMSVLRYMYKHKDAKKLYCFITDQRPYVNIKSAPVIKFMGRDCRYMDASAAIASKLSCAVVYMSCMERPEGGYVWHFEPICEDASKMPVEDMMRRYYELLEADVKAQPYNYLWTHNRWWLG